LTLHTKRVDASSVPANYISDVYEETMQPLLHLKPLFLLRDGIFSPWQRVLRQGGRITGTSTQRNETETNHLTVMHGLPEELRWIINDTIAHPVQPATLLENIGERIVFDLTLLDATFVRSPTASLQIDGDASQVIIHRTATVSRLAYIDATTGPVVIDAHAKIGAFCLVKGPVYIGQGTQLDSCRISNAIAGQNCRLGGEISDSIVGDFTNKHHDGFLGHSLVGDWVNLGALTTTSDLKNNYGEIRLTFEQRKFATGTIKFGSIIGDYVKTAIGTMLSTGTVVDIGANLFGDSQWAGYLSRFCWGKNGTYDRTIFLRDAERMMRRRDRSVTATLETVIRSI
jgi:UDP-N-acetylglucosamine diphosphorylase/glucosamine-1-phosphate N-acetyltransferase